MKKEVTDTPTNTPKTNDSTLGIISLVLGVVSLGGPGLLFGIPAIITGAIALKNKQGERGLSLAGIITGAISTVISLLFIIFIIFTVIWAINHPEETEPRSTPRYEQREQRFDSLRS
jgi:O-antigen/teichoic acid export membrane protein